MSDMYKDRGVKTGNKGMGTRAVHAGWEPDALTGSVMPPVYLTSTYVQDGPGRPRNGYEYSRTQNPTRFALEDALAELEGGCAGFAFGSGMAAIHTLTLILKAGDRVVAGDDLYGGSHRLFSQISSKFGLEFEHRNLTDPDAFETLPEDTRLIYLETPSNPLLHIASLERAVAGAKKVGAELAVDNTFATPVLQRPLEWGADYVLHSTTKYIAGHSDVIGGAIVCADKGRAEEVAFHQNSAGTSSSPFDSFLTLRGLRTLPLRMERHCSNAEILAEFLEGHPAVTSVLYPGLTGHPGHDIAASQMAGGWGGMLCFELPGGVPQSEALVNALEIFQLAESLGGVESLIELPAPMTHASVPAAERAARGISDGLVRVSVGIEDPNDLVADLAQALERAG